MESLLMKRSLKLFKDDSENIELQHFVKKGKFEFRDEEYVIDLKELSQNLSKHQLHINYIIMRESLKNFKLFVNWPTKTIKKECNVKFSELVLRERKRKIKVDEKFIEESIENYKEYQTSLVKLLAHYNNHHPNHKIRYCTLYRRIKHKLKFRYKERERGLIKRNIKELLPENIMYISHLIRFYNSFYNIIFFDESTIKNHVKSKKMWRRMRISI